MDFTDTTLLRLATSSTRAAVFDQTALEHMAATAYDTGALSLQGPYSPIFEQITLGMSVSQVGVAEGTIRSLNGAAPAGFQVQIAGLGPLLPARVDVLWRGSVVARAIPATSAITSVQVQFAVDDIDAEIVAALGALPAAPGALETERRSRLIAEMRAAMAQPSLLTDAAFDHWLSSIGASSVGVLIANHRGTLMPGVLRLQYSAPPEELPASPRQLPIAAALLIRDAGFSVAELLMESKLVREQLLERGVEVPRDSTLPARHPFLVIWVIPASVFDDGAWPGTGVTPAALRADRRQKASEWLAAEGIAVAAI